MTATQNHLWSVEDYHRMIETGILTSESRVELLEGRIVQMSPQRPLHAATTQRIDRYLQNLLARLGAEIRVQLPIALSTSEPEPDIAVVRSDVGGYADRHPNPRDILLLIEVAHTTLAIDRDEKAPIYAKANIIEYWILDIVARQVYVFQNPSDRAYQVETLLSADATLTPLSLPDIEISFSELFLPV